MKSVLSGIKDIKEANQKLSSGESKFLRLESGEAAQIRFLQELDKDGSNYDDEKGLAIGIYEHVNPDDFTQSFICTNEDEGRCAGCERVPINRRWKRRGRLLVNVLLRGDDGSPKVKILGTSMSNRGLTPQLVEYAEEYGTLCDRDYKIRRTGEGLETTYNIIPLAISNHPDDDGVELTDLNSAYKYLSYDEQLELLGGGTTSAKKEW